MKIYADRLFNFFSGEAMIGMRPILAREVNHNYNRIDEIGL